MSSFIHQWLQWIISAVRVHYEDWVIWVYMFYGAGISALMILSEVHRFSFYTKWWSNDVRLLQRKLKKISSSILVTVHKDSPCIRPRVSMMTLPLMIFLFHSQLTANVIIFIAVNIVGIYIHDRREHAQRKVFNNIRACVAGRMHMEDENEKLVSMCSPISLSFLRDWHFVDARCLIYSPWK